MHTNRYTINFFFILLFAASNVSPQWKKPANQETSLRVFTENDVLNASWTVNTDDYRSFGFGAEYCVNSLWRYTLDYYGITTRDDQTVGAGVRIDEFQVAAERAFEFHGLFQKIELLPRLGLFIGGNLGSQSIQNAWHRIKDLPEVDMKYEKKVLPSLLVEGRFGYNFVDRVFDFAEFSLRTGGSVLVRPGYDCRLEIGESTCLKGAAGDMFHLEFFYRYVDPLCDLDLVHSLAGVETGWTLRYTVLCGGMYLANEFNMLTGFSTGSAGFHYRRKPRLHVFNKEDFVFECGMMPGSWGWQARISANPWNNGRFKLFAVYAFFVPADIEYPVIRINQQQLIFGGEAALFPVRERITFTPFIAIGAGAQRAMRYSNVMEFELQHRESPIIAAEAGLRLSGKIPLRFVSPNVIYGISVSDRFVYPVYKRTEKITAGTVNYVVPINSFPVCLTMAVDFK